MSIFSINKKILPKEIIIATEFVDDKLILLPSVILHNLCNKNIYFCKVGNENLKIIFSDNKRVGSITFCRDDMFNCMQGIVLPTMDIKINLPLVKYEYKNVDIEGLINFEYDYGLFEGCRDNYRAFFEYKIKLTPKIQNKFLFTCNYYLENFNFKRNKSKE